jgi:hypothetical protein
MDSNGATGSRKAMIPRPVPRPSAEVGDSGTHLPHAPRTPAFGTPGKSRGEAPIESEANVARLEPSSSGGFLLDPRAVARVLSSSSLVAARPASVEAGSVPLAQPTPGGSGEEALGRGERLSDPAAIELPISIAPQASEALPRPLAPHEDARRWTLGRRRTIVLVIVGVVFALATASIGFHRSSPDAPHAQTTIETPVSQSMPASTQTAAAVPMPQPAAASDLATTPGLSPSATLPVKPRAPAAPSRRPKAKFDPDSL